MERLPAAEASQGRKMAEQKAGGGRIASERCRITARSAGILEKRMSVSAMGSTPPVQDALSGLQTSK